MLQAAGVELGSTYPRPVVDLAASRQRAMDGAFEGPLLFLLQHREDEGLPAARLAEKIFEVRSRIREALEAAWDEQNRFHTMPTYADSDDDWVQDKADLREYVFDTAGVYSLRSADHDGDGVRKELDFNNDNDGAVDGCEDTDRAGKYEPASGETDNFDAASHRACTPIFDILQPTETNPVNAGAFDGPDKILVQVKTATPPSAPVTYTAGDFTVRIGGQDSPVLSAYSVLDTHFLVVSAHTQAAADYYDLEVTLGSQTDSETITEIQFPVTRV